MSILNVDEYGNKYWEFNGINHRIDGPAIEYIGGDKEWRINGRILRLDGPAIEYANGRKEWCINGRWTYNFSFSCKNRINSIEDLLSISS